MASEDQNAESTSEKKANYERLIRRLKEERRALQEIADRDYREARRYVRSHPEKGISIAFISGVALGFVLGKLSK